MSERVVRQARGGNILDAVLETSDLQGRTAEMVEAMKIKGLPGERAVYSLIDGGFGINGTDSEGRTLLMLAAGAGRSGLVAKLIASGATVDSADNEGRTALHWTAAAASGSVKSLEPLLEGQFDDPARLNIPDSNGNTPLMLAVSARKGIMIARLIECGADVALTNPTGMTALHLAAQDGHAPTLTALYGLNKLKPPEIDLGDSNGDTPLHLAVKEGHEKMVARLIGRHADTHLFNNKRESLLHVHAAAEKRSEAILNSLDGLLRAPEALHRRDGAGNTALMVAEATGYQAMVDKLNKAIASLPPGMAAASGLSGRASAEAAGSSRAPDAGPPGRPRSEPERGRAGEKLLARSRQDQRMIDELNRYEAGVAHRSSMGMTALHLAAQDGNVSLMNTLPDKPSELDLEDGNGNTPLHLAVKGGHEDVAMILIERGADVRRLDGKGESLLHMAIRKGDGMISSRLSELLCVPGVLDHPDKDGNTPLMAAVLADQEEMFRRLVSSGADVGYINEVTGRTALHVAASEGRLSMLSGLQRLLDTEAELDRKDLTGRTPLKLAVEGRHQAVIDRLLDAGMNAVLGTTDAFDLPGPAVPGQASADASGSLRVPDVGPAKRPRSERGRAEEALPDRLQGAMSDLRGPVGPPLSPERAVRQAPGARDEPDGGAPGGRADGLSGGARAGADPTAGLMSSNPARQAAAGQGGREQARGTRPAARAGGAEAVLPGGSRNRDAISSSGASETPDPQGKVDRMMNAARTKDTSSQRTILSLIKGGVDINSTDSEDRTVLMLAAGGGRFRVVEELIARGAKIDSADSEGRTALHWAATSKGSPNTKALFKSLLQGPDGKPELARLKALDNQGNTPLMLARSRQDQRMIDELNRYEADIAHRSSMGMTALHLAAQDGNVSLTNTLPDKPSELDLEDGNGNTPLHLAVKGGHEDVAMILIERGADVRRLDGKGESLLHMAVRKGDGMISSRLSELLCVPGVLDHPDKDGNTPLMAAVLADQEEMFRRLVSSGADVGYINEVTGRTALHVAASEGRLSMLSGLQRLLDTEAELDRKDLTGRTPLKLAVEGRHQAVIDRLLDAGMNAVLGTTDAFDLPGPAVPGQASADASGSLRVPDVGPAKRPRSERGRAEEALPDRLQGAMSDLRGPVGPPLSPERAVRQAPGARDEPDGGAPGGRADGLSGGARAGADPTAGSGSSSPALRATAGREGQEQVLGMTEIGMGADAEAAPLAGSWEFGTAFLNEVVQEGRGAETVAPTGGEELDTTFLNEVFLNDGVLNDGAPNDNILNDGIPNDDILDDDILDGMLDELGSQDMNVEPMDTARTGDEPRRGGRDGSGG